MFATDSQQYDIIVLGNDPVGMTAALAAARQHCRVAIVTGECSDISAAWLHETVQELFADKAGHLELPTTAIEVQQAISQLLSQKRDTMKTDCAISGIDLYEATGAFLNANTIIVEDKLLTAEAIIVCSGTRSHIPAYFDCDGVSVIESDALLLFDQLPRSLVLVGGGESGLAAAVCYAKLRVPVTVIDDMGKSSVLKSVSFLKDEVIGIDQPATHDRTSVIVHLASGGQIQAEVAAINVGRRGNTEQLELERAALMADDRGRLWCNSDHQTWVPHIYGLGDVAGMCNAPREASAVVATILEHSQREQIGYATA